MSMLFPFLFMHYNIAHLEMVNVVVALWDIHCENRAVVDVLSFGKTKDGILATCARNVWLLSAMYNSCFSC